MKKFTFFSLFLCPLHILIAFYLLDSIDFTYSLRNNTETTSHWSEWPSLKNLQITNAGEGVQKRKTFSIVGGNVK